MCETAVASCVFIHVPGTDDAKEVYKKQRAEAGAPPPRLAFVQLCCWPGGKSCI